MSTFALLRIMVRANLRITYMNKPKCLNLIESFFKKFEELYEQEVLSLVSRINGSNVSSEETKIVLNTMFAHTITSTLPIAPWEEGICKVCGKDENDHVLLLCDRCNSEYHTYCLYPPLPRVPKKSWYCPTCISEFTRQAQEEDFDFSQPPKRMKIQSGLKEVANLADKMEKSDYWELGVKEVSFDLYCITVSCLTFNLSVQQTSVNLENPKISNIR